MISEEQLQAWEQLCDKDRLCYPHYECFGLVIPVQSKKLTYAFADKALEIIPRLIARVRELEASEKEATRIITDLNGCCDDKDRQIERLEREADWLAKECVSLMDAYFGEVTTGYYADEPSMQPEYWREKAREAVSND